MFEISSKFQIRKYQRDALNIAKERGNCVISLPTGTGKTLVGLMYARFLLNENKARRILVLEPTRFLVNQVSGYYDKYSNIPTTKVYGVYTKEERKNMWKSAKVIVSTPQTAYNDREYLDFDAVIIDECHHTTGEHAYAKLMQEYNFKYKLGLSATIPKKKRDEIERYIGEIFSWSWDHPDVKDFVPDWYGEVYDSEFDNMHRKIYEKIHKLRYELKHTFLAGLCSLSMRMLCRDGALALRETVEKSNMISEILRDKIYEDLLSLGNNDLHKLLSMKDILSQHDFDKAIVFVDRVVVGKKLYDTFKNLNPVLLLGRIHSTFQDQQNAVKEAVNEDVKLVISTSAGEEGIDLPSADLLIIWSNTVNVVRFIQRTGRIMRKNKNKPNKLKIVAYIATPDTPDYDALVYGLEAAAKAGVEVPGIDMKSLFKGTLGDKVTNLLQTNPASIEDISRGLYIEATRAKKWVREQVNRGRIFYFYLFPYEPIRKACAVKKAVYEGILDDCIAQDLPQFFEKSPLKSIVTTNITPKWFLGWISGPNKHGALSMYLNYLYNQLGTENRIYALTEDIPIILTDYSDYFKVPSDFKFKVNYRFSSKTQGDNFSSGTVEEIFEKIKSDCVGKKVYLNFSGDGYYTKSKISYDGIYPEDVLKLVIMNAGWICWMIEKANNIIKGDNGLC